MNRMYPRYPLPQNLPTFARGMAAPPCPPDKVFNPRTMRCVKATGRVGKAVLMEGIAGLTLGAPAVPVPKPPTYSFWNQPFRAAEPPAPPVAAPLRAIPPCPPGQQRNPETGRCIKLGGPTHQKLYPPPAPAAPPKAAAAATARRRSSSEGPARLPVGTAQPAPFGDAAVIQPWIRDNCTNPRDPISGLAWTDADTTQLQEVIRLHDRTCVMATGLHAAVKQQHRRGIPATIPGDPSTALTLDDFNALRSTMRRRDPTYKLPARAHQPPPANWQLYVASDNRSGPDFASVLIVDVTKARATPTGYEYPATSVMMDLGFIPTTAPAGSLCQPQLLVDLLDRLSKAKRLLQPVAGGWHSIMTPRSKSYWSTDTRDKIGRLCRDLTRAYASPL